MRLLSNKVSISMARRMKGRAGCPPDVSVDATGAAWVGASAASRVTADAGVLKGQQAGGRSPMRKLSRLFGAMIAMSSVLLVLGVGPATAEFGVTRFAMSARNEDGTPVEGSASCVENGFLDEDGSADTAGGCDGLEMKDNDCGGGGHRSVLV
jgi:hypothetical protein